MSDFFPTLLAALQAVAPVTNLDVGDPADRATWRFGFGDGATDAQRAAAAAVVAGFVVPTALPDISDRQCFQQLAIQNLVSTDEALAAVTVGALPKAVLDGIDALPDVQQFPAKMLLCGATVFHRAHPMVPVFFGILGITAAADVDAFWRAASLL